MNAIVDVAIPDIGDAGEVEVIEVAAKVGDLLDVGDTLLTVESDKASMDIPVPQAGTVVELLVSVGDKVTADVVVVRLQPVQQEASAEPPSAPALDSSKNAAEAIPPTSEVASVRQHMAEENTVLPLPSPGSGASRSSAGNAGVIHKAGPAARRLARELGLDISQVNGSGRSGRILKEDIKSHAKSMLSFGDTAGSTVRSPHAHFPQGLPDLSRYGTVHTQPLGNIELATSRNMQRSWDLIPHAWLSRDIDITELESARQLLKNRVAGLTMTAMVVRAMALLLKEFSRFNAAIDIEKKQLVVREYVHIGVAVDTPKGLLIAVIRDADTLSLTDTSAQLRQLSERARQGKLAPTEMQGASMTISNLGGMGVDSLQPVVNWPEVAILGVGKGVRKPAFVGEEILPRLEMSCTLGFDHRVVNGADGARFMKRLSELLADPFALVAVI